MVPKMALIWGNGGLNVRYILARNRVFWHILHQNRLRGLGCSELQEPKKRGKKLAE